MKACGMSKAIPYFSGQPVRRWIEPVEIASTKSAWSLVLLISLVSPQGFHELSKDFSPAEPDRSRIRASLKMNNLPQLPEIMDVCVGSAHTFSAGPRMNAKHNQSGVTAMNLATPLVDTLVFSPARRASMN
jgi:hypothetical protein